MNIDLLFKIAGIGILIAVLHQILSKAGREDQAMMTTLAGMVIVLTIVIKEYRKDFAIYVVIIGGALIFFYSINTISNIMNFINNLSNKTNISSEFIKLLIKITAISILIEFAVSICKDCGENAIASKLDLGGKVIVISMSIPVISTMLNGLLELLA